MTKTQTTATAPPSRYAPSGLPAMNAASAHAAPRAEAVADDRYQAMVHTYQRTGGLVSCDEAAALLRRHRDQPISVLARWIVAGTVVNFSWQGQTLVPLFQFDLRDMSLRRAASEVICELWGVFDDLDLAIWFAQPNAWLGNAAPVDALEIDQPAVLQAARADRYIARG
jgi:hypothetical protein